MSFLQVFVNDEMYCMFAARGKLEDIKGIYVTGAAYIYSVNLLRKLVSQWLWIMGVKGTPHFIYFI